MRTTGDCVKVGPQLLTIQQVHPQCNFLLMQKNIGGTLHSPLMHKHTQLPQQLDLFYHLGVGTGNVPQVK